MLQRACVLLGVFLLLSAPESVFAKKKKIKVTQDQVYQASLENGQQFWCMERNGKYLYGKLKTKKDQLFFLPVSKGKKIKRLKKKGLSKAKFKKKKKRISARHKEFVGMCQTEGPGGGGNNPAPPAPPGSESLKMYNGTFGLREARILHDRFTIGANWETLQASVEKGLQATVADLLKVRSESAGFSARIKELECNSYDEEGNPDCIEDHPNDLDVNGMRYAHFYHRALYSANPLYTKLMFWLHDEKATLGLDLLESNERYAVLEHIGMLLEAAHSGDFRRFASKWAVDHLVSLEYLDNALNKGFNPNENAAREFWELNTTGTTYITSCNNGVATREPVYGPLDVAQSALAFSGWTFDEQDVPIPSTGETTEVKFKAFSPPQHADGPKTIFIGTPYEATVYDVRDVVDATFKHPAVSQHIAEELIREFIRPNPSCDFVLRVAKMIRDADYKILGVINALMQSEALFNAANEKALIKHPFEVVVGLLRQTGYPVRNYWELDSKLGMLRQKVLYPPSIFGWNVRFMTGDHSAVNWRNALRDILTRTYPVVSEDPDATTYSFVENMFEGLADEGRPDIAAAKRIIALLGVRANNEDALVEDLVQYMDHDLVNCNPDYDSTCDPDTSTKFRFEIFFPHLSEELDSSRIGFKTRGVLLALATANDYKMK